MGIYFSEGYGLTESTSLGISNPILGLKKVGSIGIPFPDNDVRLVDVEERERGCEPRGAGRDHHEGPAHHEGILEQPRRRPPGSSGTAGSTPATSPSEDEDGYIFIVDRKKDMIIAGGFNIYPREIDEVLFQHPKVQEAVSVGIPDPYRGETVKAYRRSETGRDRHRRRRSSTSARKSWRPTRSRRWWSSGSPSPNRPSARFCARSCGRRKKRRRKNDGRDAEKGDGQKLQKAPIPIGSCITKEDLMGKRILRTKTLRHVRD